MKIKPVTSEKEVKLIEIENTMLFETSREMKKQDIKKELEKILGLKVETIRTHIKGNKKYIYAKISKGTLANDIASRLGMM